MLRRRSAAKLPTTVFESRIRDWSTLEVCGRRRAPQPFGCAHTCSENRVFQSSSSTKATCGVGGGREGSTNPRVRTRRRRRRSPRSFFEGERGRKWATEGKKGEGRGGGHRRLHLSLAACRYIEGEEEEEGLFILGVQGMMGA